MGARLENFKVEAILTSLANSMLESGTISEVHILLGILIVTIIAIRKSRQYPPQNQNIDTISTKLDSIQNKLDDLSAKSEVTENDISMLRDDMAEIKSRLAALHLELQ